jgi:lipopolysaccharide heptosyltransferase II
MFSYRTAIILQPFLALIDAVGYLLFFWLRFRTLGEPKRILLIRLEHVGDVVLTTPAFRALRKRYPQARIDVLCRDFTAPLLEKNKNVSNVISWNAPWLSNIGKKDSLFSVRKVINKLRKNKYDLAIDFHGDIRNILLANAVAYYRIGFGCRGFGFLLTKRIPYETSHAIDRALALAKAAGAPAVGKETELTVAAADQKFAQKLLSHDTRWVCIAPGSGRTAKNWLNERWAAVADELIEKKNILIVFTGSPGEKEMVSDIVQRMRHPEKALNMCGKTNLTQLAAVLQRCLLVLSPDSGTMHLARAMKTPLIGLFTKENAKEWGYNEKVFRRIAGKDAEAITAEQVLDKIGSLNVL